MQHVKLFELAPNLPSDYTDYGGKVERWKNPNEEYPDCSCGCKHFFPLSGELGLDWGVCIKMNSPRSGLLTFEHQSGKYCYEEEND